VLAAEERLLLQALELLPERRDRRGDLVLHSAIHREQLLRVFVVTRELLVAVELARDTRVFGGDLGRTVLVVPETGLAHPLLELGAAVPQRIRVKGNHAPGPAGP